jgi:hypothetical protein
VSVLLLDYAIKNLSRDLLTLFLKPII